MRNIKAYLALFCHKICKFFCKEIFYESKGGIKVLNRKTSKGAKPTDAIQMKILDPSHVLLFVDALKDEHTIVGLPIKESPHYDLVRRILSGNNNLSESDYVIRESKGILDGRFEWVVTSQTLSDHVVSSKRTCESIKNGTYARPTVVLFDGDYYALDGKHRLAVAAYLKKDLECIIVPLERVYNSHYIQKIYDEMKKREKKYTKNLRLLDAIKQSLNG